MSKKNGKTSFKNNCFSHGKTNYCGVAIGYYGKKSFKLLNKLYLSSPPKVLSAVASQFIWYNEYIKFDNNTIYTCYFSHKNLNQIGGLFENNGKMRSWEDLRAKLGLDDIKKILLKINYPRNPSCFESSVFRVW